MSGDFNVTRFSGKGRHNNTSFSMTGFLNITEELDLVRLPLSGERFTWSELLIPTVFFAVRYFSSLQCR